MRIPGKRAQHMWAQLKGSSSISLSPANDSPYHRRRLMKTIIKILTALINRIKRKDTCLICFRCKITKHLNVEMSYIQLNVNQGTRSFFRNDNNFVQTSSATEKRSRNGLEVLKSTLLTQKFLKNMVSRNREINNVMKINILWLEGKIKLFQIVSAIYRTNSSTSRPWNVKVMKL